jgi:hypothetical protein
VSENLSADVSVYPANPTGFFVETIPRFFSPIRLRFGMHEKHLFSVIAAERPVDGRHASLADFCGWTAGPFWLRPLMRTRRPVG